MRLQDRAVIVTGGGSGIGRATVELFLAEGARVAVVDLNRVDTSQLADKVQAGRLLTFQHDVADEGAAVDVTQTIVREWGRLDGLVTAAGYSPGKKLHETTLDEWNRTQAVNAGGTYLWVRESLKAMMAKPQPGGSIVTIASQRARAGGRVSAAYVSAKGAILSLTKSVALDYADMGIRCNAVLPGAIETPMLRQALARRADPESGEIQLRARHPLGRFGLPGEVAEAALYLISDASSFVTGIELPVDGGWLAA